MINFLDTNTILTIVKNKAQEIASGLVDFSIGKPWNVIANLIADNTAYNQGLIYNVLMSSRLSTATGADVDSFLADFQFSRQPSATASGFLIVSRFNTANVDTIPIGAQFKTFDGQLTYEATGVSTGFYDVGLGVYVMDVGVSSAVIGIQAVAPGVAYNTQPNTITLISSSLPGIDSVTNPEAITNGVDAESDDAVKARFWKSLETKSLGTKAAIENAIQNTQSNLSYNVVANDNGRLGFFSVYLDDGTGAPSDDLLASVALSVAQVAPFTISYQVYPCKIVYATISLSVYPAKGYDKTTVGNNVAAAIETLINNAGVAEPVAYYDVAAAARGVEGVLKIENLLLNGSIQDIGGGISDSVHVKTIVVN